MFVLSSLVWMYVLHALSRIEEPQKNWKFSADDVARRKHWADYMRAYEEALQEPSRPWAPWYAIPADSKPYMRMAVAEIIAERLEALGLHYPSVEPEDRARFEELRRLLEAEGD